MGRRAHRKRMYEGQRNGWRGRRRFWARSKEEKAHATLFGLSEDQRTLLWVAERRDDVVNANGRIQIQAVSVDETSFLPSC